jgi:ribosomal protein S12 methylthiotransferase accessory factor
VKIGLIGKGHTSTSLAFALQQSGTSVISISPESISKSKLKEFSIVLAIDHVGSPLFDKVNKNINTSWMAIELGGVGGHTLPSVLGSISLFDSTTACYSCLQTRVKSNLSILEEFNSESLISISSSFESLLGSLSAYLVTSLSNSTMAHSHVFEISDFSTGQTNNENNAITQRLLLPIPTCPSSDHSSSPCLSGNVTERAEYAIDERIGIINTISEAESFPAPYYLANLCDTTSFTTQSVRKQSAGVAINWDQAFIKTIGEALERYSSGVYDSNSFISGSTSSFKNSISPSSFVQPSPDLYEDESIDWVDGVNLYSNKKVLLPADFAVFPPPSEYYKPAITTGLAIGNSLIEAQLSGLYEVIERDATMLSWYSTRPPSEFLPDDSEFDLLSQMARSQGLTTTALLVTQDIDIPIVTVAVHRPSKWPKFAVGSCANINPNRAAIGALSEALQNWMELRSMGPDIAKNQPSAIGVYSNFPKEAQSFIECSDSISSNDISIPTFFESIEELSFIMNHLHSLGLHTYSVKLTPPDIAILGFEAVRILVPKAQPLFFGKSFFGVRARKVPSSLGNFRSRLDRSHHPYP